MDTSELLTNAINAQQRGDWAQAWDLCQQLLTLQPHDLPSHHLAAMLAVQMNRKEEAIQWFKKILAMDEQLPQVHNNLAHAYVACGQYELAEQHYHQALTIDRGYVQAYNNLAALYYRQQRLEEALTIYAQLLQLQPDHLQAHYNLGLIFLKQKKMSEAIRQFRNVIRICPKHIEANHHLANVYLLQGQYEKAERIYSRLLIQYPEHIDSLVNMGVVCIKQAKAQLAIDYFTKALGLDEKHFEARNNMAALFMQHCRYENALQHYKQLLAAYPEDLEAHYNIAVAWMALGHLAEAKTHYQYVLTKEPTHQAALINLGTVLYKSGDLKGAIVRFKQVLADDPNHQSVQFMLAALEGRQVVDKAPTDYVQHLFDNYALYYDRHMQQALSYQVPHHLQALLKTMPRSVEATTHLLDLGCGTGLVGQLFQAEGVRLWGVDLSSQMLDQAKKLDIYATLHQGEMIEYLKTCTQTFQVVIAADVFCYLGALEALFDLVFARLTEHGVFLFSIEKAANFPYKLQSSMRFAHHPHYMEQCLQLHPWRYKKQQTVIARQQLGESVEAIVYALQR